MADSPERPLPAGPTTLTGTTIGTSRSYSELLSRAARGSLATDTCTLCYFREKFHSLDPMIYVYFFFNLVLQCTSPM